MLVKQSSILHGATCAAARDLQIILDKKTDKTHFFSSLGRREIEVET